MKLLTHRVCGQVEKEEDIIVDMKRVIQLYHDPERYAMTRIVLAPCSPFTVTDSLMRRSAELARQHKKVPNMPHYLHHHHQSNNTWDCLL